MSDRFHNIAWPSVIVLPLLSSVAMMAAVLVAARSDGGAQVVDDYYNRAVAWDSLAALSNASAARGWSVDLDVDADGSASLSVTDSVGASVTGLAGTVRVRRPQLAEAVGEHAIQSVADQPGVYVFDVDATGRGIWIFDVQLRQGDLLHVDELRTRLEIR